MHAARDFPGETRAAARGVDELAPLLAEVRRFLRAVDARAADREARLSDGLLARARALGLFALTLPASHGGLELPLAGACRVVEELATVDRALAITVGLHAGLGSRALVEHGAPALRDRWLPPMASGDAIGAFAATEAGAGSDLGAIRTVARAAPGGLVVGGEKSYVTNGGLAGVLTVLASSPSLGGATRGHTLVCVPRHAPGVSVGREEEKLGIRASSTVTVRFEEVFVPDESVLGAPGRGMELAHGALAWGRTLMAAGCVGAARFALDKALAHVTARRQFGRAVGEFGATRERIARMAARLAAMRALVAEVGARHAAGLAVDAHALAAKVYASDAAFAICDDALQLHGAMGFLEPTGLALALRDCRVTRIFEGANDVLLVRLGAARVASRERFARGDDEELARAAARLDDAAREVRARWGVAAVRRQTTLQRLARAEIALLAARALGARPAGDGALGAFAREELAADALAALDGLAADERRDARVAELTDRLYSSGSPFSC